MTNPEFTNLKALFEQGNLKDLINEYKKMVKKETIQNLPEREQLIALYYFIRALGLIGNKTDLNYYFEKISQSPDLSKVNNNVLHQFLLNLSYLEYLGSITNQEDYDKSDNLLNAIPLEVQAKEYEMICIYLTKKAMYLTFNKNNKEKSYELMNQALSLIPDSNPSYIACHVLFVFGIICIQFNDIEKGLFYGEQAKEQAESIGAKERLIASLVTLSDYNIIKSDYKNINLSIDYLQKAIQLNEVVGRITHAKNNLASIYILKGELDKALQIIQSALSFYGESEALDHKSASYMLIGEIYYQQGEISKAKEYLVRTIELKAIDSSWNIETQYESLLRLCQISVEENDMEKANYYLEKIQYANQHIVDFRTTIYENLAKAIILKSSKRVKNRAKSQELLEDIINKPKMSMNFKTYAINHICELILANYLLLGDEEALVELQNYADILYDSGQDTQNYPIVIQALILKAKLKTIEENFDEATKMLEVANVFASERDLIGLENKISFEKLLINENFQNKAFQTGSKKDRLSMAKIGNYIQEAQRYVLRFDN